MGYKDSIWCDVLPMDVGQIILGLPWLYDRDMLQFGKSNMLLFEHEGNKIKIYPVKPKFGTNRTLPNPTKPTKKI